MGSLRFTSQIIADALRNAAQTGTHELAKQQRKQLASVGHLTERFAAACDQMRKRADKMPELSPWLRELASSESCALGGEGWFATAVTISGEGEMHVPAMIVDRTVSAPLAEAWNRFHPDRQISLDSAIEAPASFRAAVWPALLRLRPLRDFWERAMRRDALETLTHLLPDAWLLDPVPLPPGAVIPRLELASWNAWDSLAPSVPSITFTTAPAAADHHTEVHSTADLRAALDQFPTAPHILTAHRSVTPSLLLSISRRSGTRTDALGALVLTSLDAQPQIARVE